MLSEIFVVTIPSIAGPSGRTELFERRPGVWGGDPKLTDQRDRIVARIEQINEWHREHRDVCVKGDMLKVAGRVPAGVAI